MKILFVDYKKDEKLLRLKVEGVTLEFLKKLKNNSLSQLSMRVSFSDDLPYEVVIYDCDYPDTFFMHHKKYFLTEGKLPESEWEKLTFYLQNKFKITIQSNTKITDLPEDIIPLFSKSYLSNKARLASACRFFNIYLYKDLLAQHFPHVFASVNQCQQLLSPAEANKLFKEKFFAAEHEEYGLDNLKNIGLIGKTVRKRKLFRWAKEADVSFIKILKSYHVQYALYFDEEIHVQHSGIFADLQIQDNKGKTVSYWLHKNGGQAILNNIYKMYLKEWLDAEDKIDTEEKVGNLTILEFAILCFQTNDVLDELISAGAKPDFANAKSTPLIFSAKVCHYAAASHLLSKYEVNAKIICPDFRLLIDHVIDKDDIGMIGLDLCAPLKEKFGLRAMGIQGKMPDLLKNHDA